MRGAIRCCICYRTHAESLLPAHQRRLAPPQATAISAVPIVQNFLAF